MASALKSVLALFLAVTMVVAFQNCGEGFEANSDQLSLLSQVPSIQISGAPRPLTNQRDHIIEFDAETSRVKNIELIECALDESDWAPCTSPIELLDIEDGAHAFQIRATDSRGYESTALLSFTVDATAPVIAVNQAPSLVTGNADNMVEFSTVDNLSGVESLECSFQGGAFLPCASPLTYQVQAQNTYNLRIRARDIAQNNSEVQTITWTVDLTAPVLTLVQTPNAISNQNSASFQMAATDNGQALANFECQLDGGGFAVCASPITYQNLAEGNHSFQFRARDLANNLSAPVTYNWMLDTIAPTVQIAAGPQADTIETSATFVFSVADLGSGVAATVCQLDGGGFAACISPVTYQNLAEGSHTFEVRGTDGAGNSTVATYNWNIAADINLALAGPAYTAKGQCSEAFSVSSVSANQNPVVVNLATPLTVAGVRASTIYSDANCSNLITNPVIPAGQAQATFYIYDPNIDYQEIMASSGGVQSNIIEHLVYERKRISGVLQTGGINFTTENKIYRIDTVGADRTQANDSFVERNLGFQNKQIQAISGGNNPIVLASGSVYHSLFDLAPVVGLEEGVQAIDGAGSVYGGCAVAKDQVYCWNNDQKIAVPVAGLTGGIQDIGVIVEGSTTCAIQLGALYCWRPTSNTLPILVGGFEAGVSEITGNFVIKNGEAFRISYDSQNNTFIGTQVNGVVAASSVHASGYGAYAVIENGQVKYSRNILMNDLSTIAGLNNASELALGYNLSELDIIGCAIQGAEIHCWNSDLLPFRLLNAPSIQ